MRLFAGWLCLSLASVWLARKMWTLRSPLTRSLYVNMTSGPGGPAAPAGGRKENHQVASGRNRQKFWKSRDRTGKNK
ncbi:protein-L-histidine N-pros-methyltransferase isoform 4-T4 [Glossophaga mutica]